MNEEEKILPYDVCLALKNLDYNEYCEYMYETLCLHDGEELGTDEEFELKCEGKPYTIEYIPGGRLNKYCVKNDFDWLSVENCGAPYVEDIIRWLEKEHNILVVTMPRLVTEHMAETDYEFGITFEGHWMVNVYYVGRTLASNDKVKLVYDINPNNNYTSYDSHIKAEIDGIRQALEFISKQS